MSNVGRSWDRLISKTTRIMIAKTRLDHIKEDRMDLEQPRPSRTGLQHSAEPGITQSIQLSPTTMRLYICRAHAEACG